MKYDAFISYRREDYFLAKLIKDQLEKRNIHCFIYVEGARMGQFNENLWEKLHEAPNFILIKANHALDDCVDEGDWVRKEILEAFRCGKPIIPVRPPDFVWPDEIEDSLPEEIRRLKTQQDVYFCQEYLDATIDAVMSFMIDIDSRVTEKKLGSYEKMLLEELERPGIQCVDMAFHAGSLWRRDSLKLKVLNGIIAKKVKLRVIVNTAQTVESICSHMRDPLKIYVSFEDCINEWKKIAESYPDQIFVRIAEVPLLHRSYITRHSDGSGTADIKYYTYGNYIPENDVRHNYTSPGKEYRLYADEFDYIWSISKSI